MSIFSKIKSVFKSKKSGLLSEEISNIEEYLINSDVSFAVIEKLTAKLDKLQTTEEVYSEVKNRMLSILEPKQKLFEVKNNKPFVIFVAGVNGGGKTTTIGKLANKLTSEGKKVLIGACDTFRAGATAQLSTWAEKSHSFIEKPLKEGEDPSSVCYRSLKRAKDEGFDVLILDTSGRLQTNKSLMDELTKMQSVLQKIDSTKPDLTLLVIDGSAGQNAISQAKEFAKFIKIDGICITKLDSSSRGGAILSIANELDFGIYFAGLGEGITDLANFNAKEFIDNILKD